VYPPHGNAPESWPQYNQTYPQGPYQQQAPQYPFDPYQQPGIYPGQPFPPPGGQGRPSRSRTPLIVIGAVLGVLVLVCAMGLFLVGLGSTAGDDTGDTGFERADPVGTSERPTAAPTGTPRNPDGPASPTEESVEGDLARFKVGDCLTITGAENNVNPAKCTDGGAYKVLLRRDGTADEKVCDSTDATEILYQDGVGTSNDLVLCVAPAK
jgi:hypothetical protein